MNSIKDNKLNEKKIKEKSVNKSNINNININKNKENGIYNIPVKLIDFNSISNDVFIKKYSQTHKIVKYSDIYAFLLSKGCKMRVWPENIANIESTKKRNEKKSFKKSCSNFFIDKNKRLCQKSYIIDCFNKAKKEINSIIILKEEKLNLIETIHKGLGHIGINRTQYQK